MKNDTPTWINDDLDTEFRRGFHKLKALRNSHQIDEPEFDERVEDLAADTYAHPTVDGWCCACDVDIAFAESWLRDMKPELFKADDPVNGMVDKSQDTTDASGESAKKKQP